MTHHWHIFVGSPGGNMFADLKYEDGYKSVEDFIGLTTRFFETSIDKTKNVTAEQAMYHQLENEHDYGVYAQKGPIRVVWADCDECGPCLLN